MAALTLNNFGIAKQTKSKVLRNVLNDQSSPSFRCGEGTLQETIIHFPVLFVVKYFPRRRVIKSIFLFSWKKAAVAAVAAADTAVMAGDVSLFQVRKSARKVMDTILMARALVYTLTQTTALLLIPLTHNKPTWL